eukprot:g57752.t1
MVFLKKDKDGYFSLPLFGKRLAFLNAELCVLRSDRCCLAASASEFLLFSITSFEGPQLKRRRRLSTAIASVMPPSAHRVVTIVPAEDEELQSDQSKFKRMVLKIDERSEAASIESAVRSRFSLPAGAKVMLWPLPAPTPTIPPVIPDAAVPIDTKLQEGTYQLAVGTQIYRLPVRVEKSERDPEHHRVLRLANGLEVLLTCQEGGSKKAKQAGGDQHGCMVSGACMDVGVGSSSDPPELPGLAHLLEHVMLMGSAQYPVEDGFRVFLGTRGGFANATTFASRSSYYFTVSPNHLAEALDRFASQFREPLLKASSLQRELQAVESEFINGLSDDNRRLWELHKHTSNPQHPFNKFAPGNMQTLKVIPEEKRLDVHRAMVAFFKEYYSASAMKLAVSAKMDLDDLEELVVAKFSDIPSTFRPRPSYPVSQYGDPFAGKYGTFTRVGVESAERRTLRLHWGVPFGLLRYYRCAPFHGISHVLGHEGPGSLFGFLKAEGLVDSLNSGLGADEPDFGYIALDVDLTPSGLERVVDIVRLVYDFLGLMKAAPRQEWERIFTELSCQDRTVYRFQLKEQDVEAEVRHRAYLMHQVSPAHVLNVGHERPMSEYKHELVQRLLDCLTPSNMWIYLCANGNRSLLPQLPLQHAPHYNTAYHSSPFSPELKSAVAPRAAADATHAHHAKLHLPPPNPYLPTDFTLVHEIDDLEENPKGLVAKKDGPVQHVENGNGNGAAAGLDFTSFSNCERPDKDGNKQMDTEKFEKGERKQGGQAAAGRLGNGRRVVTIGEGPDRVQTIHPRLVAELPQGQVWHHVDQGVFPLPHARVLLKFDAQVCNASPRQRVLCQLLAWLWLDEVNEEAYMAKMAGTKWGAEGIGTGFFASWQGFSHKLYQFVKYTLRVLGTLRSNLDVARFERLKEKLRCDLVHFTLNEAHAQATASLDHTLELLYWPQTERLAAVPGLQPQDLQDFCTTLLATCHFKVLLFGNLSGKPQSTEKWLELFQDLLQQPGSPARDPAEAGFAAPVPRCISLVAGTAFYHQKRSVDPGSPNHSVDVRFQLGQDLVESRVIAMVLHQLLQQPCFKQLRSREQLGYHVWSDVLNLHSVLFLRIRVQSAIYDPFYLDGRVEAFLDWFGRQVLPQTPALEFQSVVQGLIERRIQKPASLFAQAEQVWAEISLHRLDFPRAATEVHALRRLRLAHCVSFFQHHLGVASTQRRKISCHIYGKSPQVPSDRVKFSSPPSPIHLIQEQHYPPAGPDAATSDQKDEADGEKPPVPLAGLGIKWTAIEDTTAWKSTMGCFANHWFAAGTRSAL